MPPSQAHTGTWLRLSTPLRSREGWTDFQLPMSPLERFVWTQCTGRQGVTSFAYAAEGFSGHTRPWCTRVPFPWHPRDGVSNGKQQIVALLSVPSPPAALPVCGRRLLLSVSTSTRCCLLQGGWQRVSSCMKAFPLHFNCVQLRQVTWVTLVLMTLCDSLRRTEEATESMRAITNHT